MANYDIEAIKAALKAKNFAFPFSNELTWMEECVLTEAVRHAAKQGTFPIFSDFRTVLKEKELGEIYITKLQKKSFIERIQTGTWKLSKRVADSFGGGAKKSSPPVPAKTVKGDDDAESPPVPIPIPTPTTPKAQSSSTGLDGGFLRLWNYLQLERKNNELRVTKEYVTAATESLGKDKQWIWDTLRKFETRGLIKRHRGVGSAILINFLHTDPAVGAKEVEGMSETARRQPSRTWSNDPAQVVRRRSRNTAASTEKAAVSKGDALTEREQQLLDFIIAQIKLHGVPPSMSEMVAHMGVSSKNSVHIWLKSLEGKGCISRDGRARGIKVIGIANEPTVIPDTITPSAVGAEFTLKADMSLAELLRVNEPVLAALGARIQQQEASLAKDKAEYERMSQILSAIKASI